MGRVKMRRAAVKMSQLVCNLLGECSFQLEGRSVDRRVEDLPEVCDDPSMLRLVLENLLSGAVKYTSTRGQAMIKIGGPVEG
jgi:two-component system, chemotaxis family, sensor kinase Cph1